MVALAVAGAATAGCGRGSQDSADTGVIAVTTQAARLTTLRETIRVAGTVAPSVAADFVVVANEPCAIAELTKAEGDTVQAGEIVVKLDLPAVAAELATRQLEVTEISARQAAAKAEADRTATLVEKGLLPRNQLETARSALAVAEANLSQARGRLEAARAAEANTIIRARFAGLVVKRWHNPGDLVTGLDSDPILRIIDPGRLQITAQAPAADAARILPGQTADVQTDTGAKEAAVVALKLAAQSPGATTIDVRLNFLVPTALPFDTPLQVDILVNERRDALAIPADTVQRAEGATFVWVANENNQATRREVHVGFIANNVAQIVSGLSAGEQVIVTGISELSEGTRISISK